MIASRMLCVAGVGLLFALAGTAGAETNCPDPEARRFDFWLGDWTIEQKILEADGTWLELPASTSVTMAAGGCALVERWKGEVQFFWAGMSEPEPMEGLSVRSWDPDAGRWFIYWMDTRSKRFGEPFQGTFRDGRGEFFTGEESMKRRIVFSEIEDESVLWTLSTSRDGGETWIELWIMKMRRKQVGTAK